MRSCVAVACSLCTVGFSWLLVHSCCGAYDPALDGVDEDARMIQMSAGRNKLLELSKDRSIVLTKSLFSLFELTVTLFHWLKSPIYMLYMIVLGISISS